MGVGSENSAEVYAKKVTLDYFIIICLVPSTLLISAGNVFSKEYSTNNVLALSLVM